MFEICLFDLDDTLVRTEDLKDVREACKGSSDPLKVKAVKDALTSDGNRHIYNLATLQAIRTTYKSLKLGVFTRSPRSYVQTVLEWAYPGFKWDIVVAYEDVRHTKPYGEGIDLAMKRLAVSGELDRVILVGDNDVDVRSAYHCGCTVALDKGGWPYHRRNEHWRALERVPDAVIDSPADLLDVLQRPNAYLPELERLLSGEATPANWARFDKINHFIPTELGGGHVPIHVCGRSFANYESLIWRKQWHQLTASIENNKNATVFPDAWIRTLRHFLDSQFSFVLHAKRKIIVTVVPHRPGRTARLESLLNQFAQSLTAKYASVTVAPELLAYKDGVRSQHNDHLNRSERFANVRDHLFVKDQNLAKSGASIIVLDDVVTTGASLIFASKYLTEAGATSVTCLALAKNISDVI